jgi:hypothetical protein
MFIRSNNTGYVAALVRGRISKRGLKNTFTSNSSLGISKRDACYPLARAALDPQKASLDELDEKVVNRKAEQTQKKREQ